jgi:hydroxyacylglutathione hydrolase
MHVHQFVDEGLGNSAHLVISERRGVAALIDPLRDVDRYLDAAAAAGVRITHVLETHIHNDFVTGSRELAARVGTRVGASAAAGLQFEHDPLREGDSVVVGDVKFSVLETPGHTPEHVSYVARDMAADDEPPVLFSGGSLLVGAVSRTDLLGHEHATGLARQLHRSLHQKILRLPDDVAVYPTHGAGSFCTAAPGGARSTSIGQERRFNPLLRLETPEAFAEEVLGSMPSYPTYFGQMRAINQRGPRVLGRLPAPAPLRPEEVRDRLARGTVGVDIRPVARYLEAHIPEVFHVELRPAFASWVGWVVPFGAPVVLVSEGSDVPDEAVRQLIRIGYDDLPGYLDGGMAAWQRAGLPVVRLPVLTVEEVRSRLERGEPLVVLDVRQDAEWAAGHIPGARHVEAGQLASAELALPGEAPIATYCGREQRSATALSVLERRGFSDLRLIAGGWEAWRARGYPAVRNQDDRRP